MEWAGVVCDLAIVFIEGIICLEARLLPDWSSRHVLADLVGRPRSIPDFETAHSG
jgi:hypothetical protein